MQTPENQSRPLDISETDKSRSDPGVPEPISNFVARDDFPECLLGRNVDIGGYVGMVVAIVKQSVRVRSAEGATSSFNCHTLRRIYGPRAGHDEPATSVAAPPEAPEIAQTSPARKRDLIEELDFEQPIVEIAQLVGQIDFPKSALGKHVDIGGYTGVLAEIIHDSVRVVSRAGPSRNYNVHVLRRIYGEK